MSVNEQEGFVLCSHSSSVSSLSFLGGWLRDGWVRGASFGGCWLALWGGARAVLGAGAVPYSGITGCVERVLPHMQVPVGRV